MTTTGASPLGAHYKLKSELARVCLPDTHAGANAQRRLAWINSVCLLFLIIGVAGLRTKPPAPIAVGPLEESIAAILEPLPPPPITTQDQMQDDQNPQDTSEAQRVVVVTPESPSIHFSIPTIGTVVAPVALAQAPPAQSEQAVQRSASKPKPRLINSTGEGGDRPAPEYPPIALSLGQHGVVTLLFTVDDVGKVTSIQLKQSSGSSILDRNAQDWVKRHWIVPPGEGGRVYQASINYTL